MRNTFIIPQYNDNLQVFYSDLQKMGIVGDERLSKLLYLALMSTVLEKPVSIAVKGPSATGKSTVMNAVAQFFPEDESHYMFSYLSPKYLARSEKNYSYKSLVVQEDDGIGDDYFVRTLLSEGRIDHETLDQENGAWKERSYTKEGPVGLIMATTKGKLKWDNETRVISISTDTSEEKMRAIARNKRRKRRAIHSENRIDVSNWHNFYRRIRARGLPVKVDVPYWEIIADKIWACAPRMARDVDALYSLIQACALLNIEERSTDDEGYLLAQVDDYAVVHNLVSDLIAEGVHEAVNPTVRETVDAVVRLLEKGEKAITNKLIAEELGIHPTTAGDRIKQAVELRYLVNRDQRPGHPNTVTLGDEPLPEDRDVLPHPETVRQPYQATEAA